MCSSNWNLGSWRQNLSDWISSGRVGVPNVVAHSYPVTSQLPDSSAHGPGVPRRANCPVWSCDVKDVASYLHDSVSRIGTKWWSVSHLAASAAVTLTKYTVANGHVLREEKKEKKSHCKSHIHLRREEPWNIPSSSACGVSKENPQNSSC